MNGATASTAVAYLADYRPNPTLADQLAIVTAERDQLRALYLADDHGQHAAMWRRLAVEGAVEARAEGWREGYEAGARSLDMSWPAIAAAVTGPTSAELEARRWPDGRGAAASPLPGDHGPWTDGDLADLGARWAAWAAGSEWQSAAYLPGRESQDGGA